MAQIVGILPASGSATRLGGIPKFCLPLTDEQNILQWHVEQMLKVCDVVKISTKKDWMPIVNAMNFPAGVIVYQVEPSTMSGAIDSMTRNDNIDNNKYLIGMPDTYMPGSDGEFYRQLAESDADVTVAAFDCHPDLMGRVGQIKFDELNNVESVVDKQADCSYPYMWGALAFKGLKVNPFLQNPGLEIPKWIEEGRDVKAVIAKGKYLDIGTVNGLKLLYREEL